MIQSPQIRLLFPSLHRTYNNYPFVFLDGPGGTQVPQPVIDCMVRYYQTSNSNTHGEFLTTQETDDTIREARIHAAFLLNAGSDKNISFGQNMTTLNFSLAHGIGRRLKPGDEILITQLDHEANRGPWLMLREYGMVVREVKLLPDGTLDYDDFAEKINEKTRLVAMGMASNALGTVNDVKKVRQMTYEAGAWLLLDAVAYAPHFSIDVQQLGCDFLLCSAYKIYGPHIGILYSKTGLLDCLQTDRLITNDQEAPFCIETGTLNHAALAGVTAAVKFIASLGEGNSIREKIEEAYVQIGAHEFQLAQQLYNGVKKLNQVRMAGQDFSSHHRSPTISFSAAAKTPAEICKFLAKKNICAWDCHFYALRAIQILGLAEKGGVTRLGISLYNTKDEIEFVLQEIGDCLRT